MQAFPFKGFWIRVVASLLDAIILSIVFIFLAVFILFFFGSLFGEVAGFAMLLLFVLGAIFLVSYIIYHSSVESTSYQGDQRIIYFFFLISHILLSIVVVPFVLFAFYYSLSNQIEKHKKVVKYTFPIWLYVSISGVIVYFMISPYYVQ